MDFQAALCCKQFITVRTGEFLDAGVRLAVGCQRTFDGEGSEALFTLVWFLVRVYPNVTNQITRLLKLLGAVDTLMPSDTIHLCVDLSKLSKFSEYKREEFKGEKLNKLMHNMTKSLENSIKTRVNPKKTKTI